MTGDGFIIGWILAIFPTGQEEWRGRVVALVKRFMDLFLTDFTLGRDLLKTIPCPTFVLQSVQWVMPGDRMQSDVLKLLQKTLERKHNQRQVSPVQRTMEDFSALNLVHNLKV